MAFIQGSDRFQIQFSDMFSFDLLVSEDNPVRVIDAFVDSLNLKDLGFIVYSPNSPGQRPYETSTLLKIHIYCFFNGIQSSRKQERECSRNIELIWLTGNLKPDHTTIANFFKDNTNAIKKVFKEFSSLCRKLDLYDFKVDAFDGTKIKAYCSKKNAFTKDRLISLIDNIDKKISEYSSLLNDSSLDAQDLDNFNKKLELIKQRKVNYTNIKDKMEQDNVNEICITDTDCKIMKNHQNIEPCYNVQSVVDSKNKLILDYDVTSQANDVGLLKPMVEKVIDDYDLSNTLFKDNPNHVMTALADTGYYKTDDILELNTDNIKALVPKPKTSNSTGDSNFSKDNFKYDINTDTYICPAGYTLSFSRFSSETRNGKTNRYKIYNTSKCSGCKYINKCTKSVNGRSIKRNINEDKLDKYDANYKSNSDAYKLRKALVEHPFGTIKYALGLNHVYIRGLEKVTSWAALSFLAYNLKRVINIMGTNKLIEAIATR